MHPVRGSRTRRLEADTCFHCASSPGFSQGPRRRSERDLALGTGAPLALLGPCFKTGHGGPTQRQLPGRGRRDRRLRDTRRPRNRRTDAPRGRADPTESPKPTRRTAAGARCLPREAPHLSPRGTKSRFTPERKPRRRRRRAVRPSLPEGQRRNLPVGRSKTGLAQADGHRVSPESARSPRKGPAELPRDGPPRHPGLPSQRFHALLNSLFKVLFTFPSRYLSAIGLGPVFSLGWSLPPDLSCIPKQLDSTSASSRPVAPGFQALRGSHPLGRAVPSRLRALGTRLRDSPALQTTIRRPCNWSGRRFQTWALRYSRFARRYWGNPGWFLFLRLLICLSSAGGSRSI